MIGQKRSVLGMSGIGAPLSALCLSAILAGCGQSNEAETQSAEQADLISAAETIAESTSTEQSDEITSAIAATRAADGASSGGDVLGLVDPFIGTGGHGHTYPGAVAPFGMVQLSPDNPSKGWDWTSGYHYSDDTLLGFSHTHLSGTGVGDLLDILVTPYRGNYGARVKDQFGRIFTRYSHDGETASPGYYRLPLPNEKLTAELTATTRVGLHRYTFEGEEAAKLFINLGYAQNHDNAVVGFIRVVSDTKIVGYRISHGWAPYQPVYFAAEFNKPFTHQIYRDGRAQDGDHLQAQKTQISLDFGAPDEEPLIVKLALSYTGFDNAAANLDAEAPGFDFEGARAATEAAWREQLSKFDIETADRDHKKIFYTALYHSSLAPHHFSDVDGGFYGGDGSTHENKGYNRYTLFSLWDTFRTLQPLLTITNPDRLDDMVKSMMGFYEETGLLPSWEFVSNETDVMIGYHAIPVIADAYLKGLTTVDGDELLEAMKASAMQNRFGIDHYREYGYVPSDLEVEAVSKTLEYAYDDWAIAEVAKALGREEDYQVFSQRAQSYRALYDPSTGFMRGRGADGSWVSPFNPAEVSHRQNDYAEANAWQYTWFVPHDVPGLMELMGGEAQFVTRLEELFTTEQEMEGHDVSADISGLIGQYVHGNEPSHHIPYLYAQTSQPEKGEARLREIMTTMYKAAPDGLAGNDDVGQMSAWYVMSALGFYPLNPVGGEYTIGFPLFDEVSVDVGEGKTFTVTREGPADGRITGISLNGERLNRRVLQHDDVMAGGTLEFVTE